MMRGSTRGALTIAIAVSRPNASVPESSITKLRLLLTTCGNGCAGSSPIGVRSGRTSRSKYCATQARSAAVNSVRRTRRTPARSSAGSTSRLSSEYWASISARASTPICVEQRAAVLQRHPGRRNLGPQLLLDAGDPDLEELVEIAAGDAEEAQPLEERRVGVRGQREHAPVEGEERKLAVERSGVGGAVIALARPARRRAGRGRRRRGREAGYAADP